MILNDRVSGKLPVAGLLLCSCIAGIALPGWSLDAEINTRRSQKEQVDAERQRLLKLEPDLGA